MITGHALRSPPRNLDWTLVEFLMAAVEAALRGNSPPSLLSADQGAEQLRPPGVVNPRPAPAR